MYGISDGCKLEGWLMKKKTKDKSRLFSGDTLRWFRIQEVRGLDNKELALCYFKAQSEREARGWIYLKDITEIFDDEKVFTVASPSRTMSMSCSRRVEHLMWLQTLVDYAPQAKIDGIKSAISVRRGYGVGPPMKTEISAGPQASEVIKLNAGNTPLPQGNKTFDRSSTLFSRYAHSANSFQKEKDQMIASLSRSEDIESENPSEEIDHAESVDLNSSFFSSRSDRRRNSGTYSAVANNGSAFSLPSAGSDDFVEEGKDNLNRDSIGIGDNIARSKERKEPKARSGVAQGREDHRLSGYRGAGQTSATTNRLHRFISRENDSRTPSGSDIEDYARNSESSHGSKQLLPPNSWAAAAVAAGAIPAAGFSQRLDVPSTELDDVAATSGVRSSEYARDELNDDEPDEEVCDYYGNAKISSQTATTRQVNSGSPLVSRRPKEQLDNDIEDVVEAKLNRARRRALEKKRGKQHVPWDGNDSDSNSNSDSEDEIYTRLNRQRGGTQAESPGRSGITAPPSVATAWSSDRKLDISDVSADRPNTNGDNHDAKREGQPAPMTKKKALPPPSAPPPRKATDGLVEVNNSRANRNVNDLLAATTAAHHRNISQGSKHSDSGTPEILAIETKENVDSSSDEDIDFKAELRRYAHEGVDGSSEFMMRASGSPLAGNSNSGNSLSKPPRHPPGKGSSMLSQNAEAANQKKSQRDKSADGVIRSNTPPRRAADPGSKIDFDFASENWDSDSDSDEKPISSKPADDAPDSGNKNNSFDEDSDEGYNEITIRSRNDSRIGSSVKLSSNNSLAGNSISSSGNTSMQAGVYVDSNWLQEDFDND